MHHRSKLTMSVRARRAGAGAEPPAAMAGVDNCDPAAASPSRVTTPEKTVSST